MRLGHTQVCRPTHLRTLPPPGTWLIAIPSTAGQEISTAELIDKAVMQNREQIDRLEKKIKYNTDEDEAEVPPRLPASQASALKNQSTEERPVSHPYSNRQKAPVELMKSKRTSKEETRSNR